MMRFYSSFSQLLGNCMRNEITLKALEALAFGGEVVLLTECGFNHVLGTDKFVPVELTWSGVDGVKVAYAEEGTEGLVSIELLNKTLLGRWMRFKSMLLKLESKGKLICNVNPDHRNWYIHTVIKHGHQYMFDYTSGWDGSIAPELEGGPIAEVYINLSHLLELDPKEQALALAAVEHEMR